MKMIFPVSLLNIHVVFVLFIFFFLVPAVTIVVEGGKDTITNMYYDLRANIPVVIIDVS